MLKKLAALGVATLFLCASLVSPVVGDTKSCSVDDQLPCSCENAGYTYKDPEYRACFLGDVNFPTKTQIDPLSANAFVALSWPVKTNKSGAAEVGMPDFSAELTGDWTPVWATWKSNRDIFRQPKPPVAWSKLPDDVPAECKSLDLAVEKAKFPYHKSVPDAMPPRVLSDYLNPHRYALIDGDGVPVRFDISMNRQAYDYVVKNSLWNAKGLGSYIASTGKLDMPVGTWGEGDKNPPKRGAIALKSAWKILTPKDRPERFHKEWAYVTPVIKDGKVHEACQLKPVGLVALHIVYKTDQMKDWSWGTFEHREAAPTWAEVGATSVGNYPNGDPVPDWLFYRNNSKGAVEINKSEKNDISANPSRIVKPYPPGYYFGPVVAGQQKDCTPTNQEFRCINVGMADHLKGSVFANYELVGTQWMQTSSGEEGLLLPEVLGNVAMETYSQGEASCLTCHSYSGPKNAQGRGVYDFLFSFKNDVENVVSDKTGQMETKE